jgi:hypothetical protein
MIRTDSTGGRNKIAFKILIVKPQEKRSSYENEVYIKGSIKIDEWDVYRIKI